MKTFHWLLILSFVLLVAVGWELNHQGSLGDVLWAGYVSLAVVSFTLTWMALVGFAVVKVGKLAAKGWEVEKRQNELKPEGWF